MELEFIKLELGGKLKQTTRLMSIEKKLERGRKKFLGLLQFLIDQFGSAGN
jgi:hypothetical protein